VPRVNRGDTPERGWIHLKVGIECVLFLVGLFKSIKFKALFKDSLLTQYKKI